MSIVAIHGPNTFGSKSIVSNASGSAYAIVNPANGLIWTLYAKDQSQVAANYDWAYTGAAGTPASPIADTKQPVVTFTAGTHDVTLTLNGVAQPPFTITAVAGVAPLMAPEEEAMVSQLAESPAPPEGDGDGDTQSSTTEAASGGNGEAEYDPGEHTVSDVQEHVNGLGEDEDAIRAIYDAEVAGKNRATLVAYLESLLPFDPAEYTVEAVVQYASENPELVPDIIEAEKAGKNRTTLLSQLEALQST